MQSIKVKDYMTLRAVTFSEQMTLTEASRKILNSHQIGGPVINSYKHVVGFLSEKDCLERMLEDTYQNETHHKVIDVMSTDVLCVDEDYSVLELAQSMIKNKPKIFPVVDSDERLVGVITRSDVLKAIEQHHQAVYEAGHRRFV